MCYDKDSTMSCIMVYIDATDVSMFISVLGGLEIIAVARLEINN